MVQPDSNDPWEEDKRETNVILCLTIILFSDPELKRE